MNVNSAVGGECGQAKRRDYFGITIDVDPAGRRLWPAEVSQRIAAASFSSKLSVEQFAAEWDVNPSSLSKWRMAEKAGRVPKPPRKRTKALSEPSLFAEAVTNAEEQEKAVGREFAHIEIECGGVCVRVPLTAKPDLISTILGVMRGQR